MEDNVRENAKTVLHLERVDRFLVLSLLSRNWRLMNPNYVCSRCTRQLLRSQHQLRKASFVSLGKLVGHDNSSELPQPEASAEAIDHAQSNPRDGRWVKRKYRKSFAQQYRESQKPTGIDKVLETLFTSNQAQKVRASRSRYSRTPIPQVTDNGKKQTTATEIPHAVPEVDAHTTSQVLIAERDTDARAANVSARHAAAADRFKSLRSLVEKKNTPLEDIWQECNKLLRYRADVSDIQSQYPLTGTDFTTLRDVLLAICRHENLGAGKISVAPADVIRLYTKFRVMKYWWHEVLWIQLGQVVKLRYSSTGQDLDIDSRLRLQGLIYNILEVWRLFLRLYGAPNSKYRPIRSGEGDFKEFSDQKEINDMETKSAAPNTDYSVDYDWDGFPSLEEANRSSARLPKELTARFVHFLPKHPSIRRRTRYVAAAAAMTLTCFQESATHLNGGSHNFSTAKPFVDFLQVLAYEVASERETALSCLLAEDTLPEVINKALASWVQVHTDATDNHRPNSNTLRRPDNRAIHDERFETKPPVLSTELEKAVNRTDAPEALKLWEKAQNAIDAGIWSDASALDKVFVHFISAFFKIRRPEDATSVWNYMIQKGHKPGQMHWTAMLQGCAHRGRSGGGDFASLQNIWSNMMRSGVQPDTGTWTTYIHSLIKCRKWQEGLAALEQLGRTWNTGPDDARALHRDRKSAKSATGPETEKLVPSIAPVRAALSALIDIEKFDCLPAVISWAESHSLQLDTYSYNILLRPLVRTGTPLDIQRHLSEMSHHNCQPDITTFTIILNGLVSNRASPFRSLPLAEQESTIVSILQDMEAHSIYPNPHTYSTLLDGLLSAPRSPDPSDSGANIQAARAVLAHMDARNIKPSSYIYTILLTHYFSLSPPDLPAIDSLWESVRNRHATSMDPVFYDRMIEGYADADEYEKALAFVRRMPKEGRSPGWVALGKVLGALERAEEWKVVGELVRDVEDEEGGLLSWGERNLRGKNEFWSRADGIRARGLLKEEGLG